MSMNHNKTDAYQPSLDELISLREASELSGFTQPYVAHLIRRGALWGKKIGRNWVTTTQAVNEYLSRGIKPGPKSKKPKQNIKKD